MNQIRILDAQHGPELPIVDHGGRAFAVAWPGAGATQRSLHRVVLDPGGATVGLRHSSDSVYYVIAGTGSVSDPSGDDAHQLVEGSFIHVDGRTWYRFEAGRSGIELVGGPAPADPALYEHLGPDA